MDCKVSDVLTNIPDYELGSTTIRDLATKSGAKYFGPNRIEREEVACDLIRELTGCNIAELLTERIFKPMELTDTEDKKRIFGWYYQDKWYYASGAAGCHCVVVPEFQAVAVRMFNRYTEDYTEDQNSFNEIFYNCLQGV
ncbi:hypothetical protein ABN764_26490 [Paenibacillaceae sp. P-4]|uniref:hypothetical protein n=1 Tax=Paenibacillaceae bacterium P-4 TaxID=3160969 RepID=UPI0032E839BD